MPDVNRSDSQRSNSSLRPRVSFNRDVHVKRIVTGTESQTSTAVSSDAVGHLVPLHVQKKPLDRSKPEEIRNEAAKVLHQLEQIKRNRKPRAQSSDKFNTIPARKWKHKSDTLHASNEELTEKKNRTPLSNLFKKSETNPKPKKLKLGRSVSDASNLKPNIPRRVNKKYSSSDSEENQNNSKTTKTQLSPIIEVSTPREDYFTAKKDYFDDKENAKRINDDNTLLKRNENNKKTKKKNDDNEGFGESKQPGVIIIDIDKAKNINRSDSNKKSGSSFKEKFKLIGLRKGNKEEKGKTEGTNEEDLEDRGKMHSSQAPVEKVPLTRGYKVDKMVKRLSKDMSPPPPKTSVLITPTPAVAHNNNQPFSYTQPRSNTPEKIHRSSPVFNNIVYAQVVVGNNDSNSHKETIFKHFHSDSDEGLGYEEHTFNKKYFGDETPRNHNNNNKFTTNLYLDSSARGRGDGRDTSVKEIETSFDSFRRNMSSTPHRSDLSHRRDLLESRIQSRFHSDKYTHRTSPEVKRYGGEFICNYKRSSSPLEVNETPQQPNSFIFDGYDSNIQSDNLISSSENIRERRMYNTLEQEFRSSNKYRAKSNKATKFHHKSNPEIHKTSLPKTTYDTYHSSLQRPSKTNEQYLDENDAERKDKFGDSGIENDFKKDDKRKFKTNAYTSNNESEDEGFVSSLLIASERQHTEENFTPVKALKDDLESDFERGHFGKDVTSNKYKEYKSLKKDYVHRERSIDDGSHYDPRIDKDFNQKNGKEDTLKKKPPKPTKKSGFIKLFSRDTNKKAKKDKEESPQLVREESLRARYKEYKGASQSGKEKSTSSNISTSEKEIVISENYKNRNVFSTPSPSPTAENENTLRRPKNSYGKWFKTIDRLSRKPQDKIEKEPAKTNGKETPVNQSKSLRFFGDTDNELYETQDVNRNKIPTKHRSHSSRNLHNISEELNSSDAESLSKSGGHKSLQNLSRSGASDWNDSRETRGNLRPPVSPGHRTSTLKYENRPRSRRRNEVSSVESSTEGESSQQSQRSVVYLHAATVGDIPNPGYLHRGARRVASREELDSNASPRIQSQTRTLSRSISVLAPWRPKHPSERLNIDYSQDSTRMNHSRSTSTQHLSRISDETPEPKKDPNVKRSAQNLFTLTRKTKSKENFSDTNSKRKSTEPNQQSTLFKKKEKPLKENPRYIRDDRKKSSKSMSVESLNNGKSSKKSHDNLIVSRSLSMPRDPEKSAGWMKNNKSNKKGTSMQKLG